ncbi:MAG: hypothetical protein GX444_00365, partial [Myxococcales bacterium]|nr:hypothetical protein [Myxococcales bacterium]
MRHSTHLLFSLILFFALIATAQAETHWIRFDGTMADQNAKIVIQDNSKSDFEFRMHLPGLRVRDIVVDGADWQDLDFGQSTRQANPGDPAVPVFSRWIALPQGAAPQIEVTLSNATVIENVNCAPAQAPYADCYGEPDPEFARNEKIYDKNAWWPEKPYRVEGPYVIRGLRMFLLQIYPVQINPVTLQARAYADAVVHVGFSGSKGRFFDRHQAASFQAIYEQAMNRMAFADETPPAATGKSPNGAEYVILTDPAFVDPAQDLADWKILQGYDTEIYTTDEVGTTAAAIKAWVQEAYDTWDPAPEFVLFIGDSEHITPTYDDPYIASDLYYFTVDGSDIFADIAYARITADTVEELQKHITDIINYQRYPIVDSAFYTNSYHAAYFQHQGGGYEERRFLRTTEETYQWFNQYMADSPFTPHRIYVTEAAVTPRFWNQDVYLWTASWWTYSTVDIVPELLRANGFAWNGGASDITAAVNGGTSFLTHRDHGDTDGWSDPAFVTNQVLALTNGDKQPIVWSINCLTGYFDNDDKNGECFSEAWERNVNGGAVGVLASTRVSYSGINDRMFWGWLDSMWPEFIPEYPTGTNNSPEWRASLLMLYGKLYMDTCYPGDAYATEGIEEFHWFGDPTQELYAGEPQTFTVSHLPIVPMGATGFDVEVNADDARVALVQNGLILGKAYSAGGAAHIEFDGPIGDMTDVHLTITRRNYRPYETDIMVGATSDGIVALNRVAYSESDT